MNDFDDEADPHAFDPAFHAPGLGGLGEELLDAISPPASPSGTPRKGRRAPKTTMTSSVTESASLAAVLGAGAGAGIGDEGLSLAEELAAGPSSPIIASRINGFAANNLGDELSALDISRPHQSDSLGDELRGLGGDADASANAGAGAGAYTEAELEERATLAQSRYEDTEAILMDSMKSTEIFVSRLSAVAGSGQYGAHTSSSLRDNDDTTKIELSGKQMGFRLQEMAKERDAQVRELQEMVRALSRPDPDNSLQLALAEVSSILDEDGPAMRLQVPSAADMDIMGLGVGVSEDATGYSRRSAVPGGSRRTRLDALAEDESGGEDEEHLDARFGRHDDQDEENDDSYYDHASEQYGATHRSSSSIPPSRRGDDYMSPSRRGVGASSIVPPGPSRKAPLSAHIAHLLAVNSTLISSLQNLNENTQVSQAGMREKRKTIGNVRLGFTELKKDADSVEQSRKWIDMRASKEGTADTTTGAGAAAQQTPTQRRLRASGLPTENVRAWADGEMRKWRTVIEEAATRAEKLLRPVESPLLDGLASAGGDAGESKSGMVSSAA